MFSRSHLHLLHNVVKMQIRQQMQEVTCTVVGVPGAGKTSLVMTYITNSFPEYCSWHYVSPLGWGRGGGVISHLVWPRGVRSYYDHLIGFLAQFCAFWLTSYHVRPTVE